jgi:hypothetical protein
MTEPEHDKQADDTQQGEITCEGYGPVPDEPMTDIEIEEDSSSEGRTQ